LHCQQAQPFNFALSVLHRILSCSTSTFLFGHL
jgi:hypothetical protein